MRQASNRVVQHKQRRLACFMRILHITIINAVALVTMFLIGCSKKPVVPPPEVAPVKTSAASGLKDLGAVILTEQTPERFVLGDGKGCMLIGSQSGAQLPGGIDVKLAVTTTNADGTVTRTQGEVSTLPGRKCAIVLGDVTVMFAPTLKPK